MTDPGPNDPLDAAELGLPESDALAGELAAALAPSVPPPPGLFGAIERRIAESFPATAPRPASPEGVQVWKSWGAVPAEENEPGILTVRASRTDLWERTEQPGVEVKRLHVDPAARRVTMLVRMAAGAAYPRHRHGDDEECLVLEGSLRVGGEILRRGDYQIALRGSAHGVQDTEEGCLLLISSGLGDELGAS
ncbi:MAG: cupin domain-containing protein [Planctomycetes bacterium]|nr:cupin domain-containing protein [Planctomycetota bacterium]